jgi:hypothetical protein
LNSFLNLWKYEPPNGTLPPNSLKLRRGAFILATISRSELPFRRLRISRTRKKA